MAHRTSLVAVVVVMVYLSAAVDAQVFYRGNCPRTPIIKDFDWDQYLGRWFEQERYFVAYQEVGRCWSGTYLRNAKSGKISVRLDFRDVLLKQPKQITVDVFQKRPYEAPNRLTYTIPGVIGFEDNYEVLATDYNNWTLEYACVNKPPFGHTRTAWILTRSPHPSAAVIRAAKDTLTHIGIDVSLLKKQETSCFV
ncbi:apolipoprotein D-like [Eriocheir sinensis]|uniref:apolipoprotein D-like n=1 Tax=Eriocheir sinensis TaxID=95602 RepID=UPI0021C7D618|nr:apolipoprotein D-like [Eriocheir sinensis]